MERRTQGRRSFAFRLVTLLGIAGVAIFTLAACGDDSSPYTTISPRTDEADEIQFLYKVLFFMALVVFIGVQAAIVYTVLRFRRRSEEEERPEQIHGNKTLEIVWTIIPAVVLLVIFIPTVQVLYGQADDADEGGDITIEVYAKQWWWEIHYKDPDNVADVITANEVHVPAGKKVLIKLYSNNVIHSFWVPQLMGKMDVIPGHENKLTFTPNEPGVYFGECAEFCGDAHAWMRFQVIVEPEDQFNEWIAAWKAGPSQAAGNIAAGGDVTKVPPSFGICLACHRVNGTNANVAPVGLDEEAGTMEEPGPAKIAGPNLTLFGCRTTIGAGILPNTPEDLANWLRDPGAIKPGNYMATLIKPGTLKENEIAQLVDYLESLTPEGGCAPYTGENVDLIAQPNLRGTLPATPAATPVASPEASPVASPSPAATPAGGELPTEVTIEEVDIAFNPNEFSIPANTDVTVTINNTGAAPHNFSIDDLGIDVDTAPGQTSTVTINAPPGDYEYYCNVPGHREAGMVGTLHVE
jgi:cytochrome c oxidase subunit 2